MDAFELLKQDHEKVSKLFSKIEAASGQAKSELLAELKTELDLHAHVEETVLYPALENTEEAREITLEAYEEHKVVKDLLGELANATDQNEEWDAKLKVLKENVEHHVEEEEGELFGKARKALGQERIETLGVELEAEKASKSRAPKPRMATEAKSTAARKNKTAKSESPGVLQRIANLVGLSESPSDKANSTRPAKTPAKKSSKKQAAKSKSESKSTSTSASASALRNVSPSKAGSKSSAKSGPAKSAKSAPKAAARKPRGEARTSKRATATSKKAASRGSRASATKTASRAASNQRVTAGGKRGAKKARGRKSSSGTRNKSR